MGFIEDELSEVRNLCENVITGTRLVSCVWSMVRVEIKKTDFKNIIACIQFPKDYPRTPLLLELKSKTLHEKLLLGLTRVCEEEAKKLSGKAQILALLKFIKSFLDETPLACCYEEINALKARLNGDKDEFKLRQKSSSIYLKVVNGEYFLSGKLLFQIIIQQ